MDKNTSRIIKETSDEIISQFNLSESDRWHILAALMKFYGKIAESILFNK